MSMRRATGRNRRPQPSVVSGYAADDPRAWGTPVFWYEPNDLATITKDGSNRVSSMLDKSGNGYDLSNAGAVGTWPVYAAGAVNGYASLDFANQTLNRALGAAALGANWSIFLVISNRSAITTSGSILRQADTVGNTGLDLTMVTRARTVTCRGVVVHTGGNVTDNTFEVWWLERINTPAAPTLKVNGVADPLSNSATTGYTTGATTLDLGVSANACRIAHVSAFNATGINAAYAAALKTRFGL